MGRMEGRSGRDGDGKVTRNHANGPEVPEKIHISRKDKHTHSHTRSAELNGPDPPFLLPPPMEGGAATITTSIQLTPGGSRGSRG